MTLPLTIGCAQETNYTHTLPDAMEHARKQLDAFLADANADKSHSGGG